MAEPSRRGPSIQTRGEYRGFVYPAPQPRDYTNPPRPYLFAHVQKTETDETCDICVHVYANTIFPSLPPPPPHTHPTFHKKNGPVLS